MAGRPAAARGGSSGLLYGLIAFAVLTVIFLVLFVLMLTRVKNAEDAAASVQSQIQSLGRPDSFYSTEAGNRRTTVFQVMEDEIKGLAQVMVGSPDPKSMALRDHATTVIQALAAAHPGVVSPGDSMSDALRKLGEALAAQKSTASDLNARLERAQSDVTALTEQQKSIREEFEGQVKSFDERLTEIERRRDEALAAKDTQVTDLTASLETANQDLASLRRESVQQQRDSEFEIAKVEKRLTDLQGEVRALKPSQFDRDAILRKSDGKVMRAIPGSDIAYVNLGTRDGARVGMGLEVYSRTGEQRDSVRGKASMEIVTLAEEVAECRVTRRTPGAPILEGDVVVNIAFERNRKPKFVVLGDFDLNYDGATDITGVETMTGIVREWGGQVVDEVDESVDYVVIGLSPRIPTSPGGTLTDVVRDQQFYQEMAASRFADAVKRANELGVPVLSQNQFLFLTGYAGDQPIQIRR